MIVTSTKDVYKRQISIFSKLLSPDFIIDFPKSIRYCNPTSLSSNLFSDFISIKYSTSGMSSFIFLMSSAFFGEYIIADALDLFTMFSNSFNGNSLSVGTAIPVSYTHLLYKYIKKYIPGASQFICHNKHK